MPSILAKQELGARIIVQVAWATLASSRSSRKIDPFKVDSQGPALPVSPSQNVPNTHDEDR